MTDREIVAEVRRLREHVGIEVAAYYAQLSELAPEDGTQLDKMKMLVAGNLSDARDLVVRTVENRPAIDPRD